MSADKQDIAISGDYIAWLLELSTAPGTMEIRDEVRLCELTAAIDELNKTVEAIADSCMKRRIKSAVRKALEAQEKLGFCVGHLSHERGV